MIDFFKKTEGTNAGYAVYMPSYLDPMIRSAVFRIKNVAGYGYDIRNTTRRKALNDRLVTMRRIAGLPSFWYLPEYSANRNFLTFTDDFSNAVWTKNELETPTAETDGSWKLEPTAGSTDCYLTQNFSESKQDSTFTIEVKAETDFSHTIALSLYGGGFANLAVETFTPTTEWQRVSVSATFTAGEINACLLGYLTNGGAGKWTEADGSLFVRFPQVQAGDATTYQARTNATATKALDLVASADGTFTNGTSADMFDGSAFLFSATSSQYIQTTYELPTEDQTLFLKFNFSDTSDTMLFASDATGAFGAYLTGSGKILTEKAGTESLTLGDVTISPNTTYIVAIRFTESTGKVAIFVNGVLDKEETHTVTFEAGKFTRLGAGVSAAYPNDGKIFESLIFESALTNSQIQQISNLLNS